ncbi:MAG: hypothetical protein GY946_03790 [bacterium]|nr:hypothetical protein [bacterium]
MTGREIAMEFTEMWEDLDISDINTMLAKNVSMELLEFFSSYAEEFSEICARQDGEGELLQKRLPNLLIIGYIIRVLEERLND